MSQIIRNFDKRLEHRALGSAAVTADTTVDTITQRVAQRTRYVTKLMIEAAKISANNELYTFVVEVSNDDFTTVDVAAIATLGATEVRQSNAPDTLAGDEHDLYWASEVNGVPYVAARLRVLTSGTGPSITFGAWSGIEGGV